MHTEYFRTDELDQYRRRENVRIFGIPEDYTVEDDGKNQVLKLAGELNISLQEKYIQRVHRLGKKKRSKAAKPRGIIARFVSYAKKQEFIEKRKKLKGTKIAVCEDLRSTRYKLYTYLQNHPNIRDAYVWNGAIKVTYKNTWYNIKNTDDLFQLSIDINWKELGVKFLADLHAE